jgi:amino acid adenylation domain-containing protein
MCEDSATRLVISRPALAARLPAGPWTVVDAGDLAALAPEQVAGPCPARPENLAYLIYTSGSTGRPKASAIEHRSTVALIAWARAIFPADELDGVLFSTSICFDLSVFELFATLALGGKLILAENVLALPEIPARGEVRFINTVPSAMNEVVRNGWVPPGVRVVLLCGEALPASLADRIYATGTVAKVYDCYGPSEDTTYSTWTLREPGGPATIGRAMANTQLYVLDSHLQPVPIGVVGELFLAGEGLARGYLGRPDLTAEKFIADPFALTPGARMYRTGDLGRLRPDGQADFLGRSDHQIKIRGFRVELGEIEAVLRKKVEVAEALVTVRDGKLVAYVEWPAAPSEWKAVLRSHLEEKLPSYMVPALWARIERWPLLPNAKINRKALPPPEVETSAATAAPQGEVEILLAQLWSELLGVPAVGRGDNFFALGGDSILSLQVVARAAVAGITLSAQAVFRHQTLMQLAAVAETVAPVPRAAAPGEVGGAVPLTPIQHWFFSQPFTAHAHWNQSALFMTPAGFDPGRFESALRRVLARHDGFQQRYHRDASGWRVEAGDAAASTQVSAAPWSDFAHACADAQAGLDLATGPLMRAVIFAPPATGGAGRVLLVIHHLAIDGVSWRFLLDELATAYASPQAPLPAVPSTWARWARALVREASSETTRAELGWWEAISAQPLPRDRPAPGCGRAEAEAIVTTTLDPADTQRLLRDSATAYQTQVNDLLLTALAQTLARWTGLSGATVALEGHGREEIADGPDVMRTMGWFTTLYPVALSLVGAAGDGDAIKQVKEQLRAVPRRGRGMCLDRSAAPRRRSR